MRGAVYALVAVVIVACVSLFFSAGEPVTAQTKGKTPLQICQEKFANLKGAQKSTAITGCVEQITSAKGKK